MVECISAVDLRLADFRAGVCEAEFEHELSERYLIAGARLTHLLRVVDLPDDGFPTRPLKYDFGVSVDFLREHSEFGHMMRVETPETYLRICEWAQKGRMDSETTYMSGSLITVEEWEILER